MAVEQSDVELAFAADQRCGCAGVARHLDEPLRVGARLRPDHEDQRGFLRQALDGVLAVLGCVTDVICGGSPESTEPLLESIDRRPNVVERQGRLGDHRDRPAPGVQPLGVFG